METEYHIPLTREIKEDVENMCNLAQGIANEAKMEGKIAGVTETTENIVLKMHSDNVPIYKISLYTNRTAHEIRIIIQNHEALKV